MSLFLVAGVAIACLLVGAEWLWLALHRPSRARGDIPTNLAIFIVGESLRLLMHRWHLGLFAAAYAVSPVRRGWSWLDAVSCYVLVDLTLYGWHRVLHETAWGWAFHSTHHSSKQYELTLGGRVNWVQRLVDDVVYLPLALLWFHPMLLMTCIAINRLAQFWPHTLAIGALPWLDGWLNTPANHRVHHHEGAGGKRRNYGSNFMWWDHLFGTYQAESGPAELGTDLGDVGRHPWHVQWAGLRAMRKWRS